jgi:hypothetical protein
VTSSAVGNLRAAACVANQASTNAGEVCRPAK